MGCMALASLYTHPTAGWITALGGGGKWPPSRSHHRPPQAAEAVVKSKQGFQGGQTPRHPFDHLSTCPPNFFCLRMTSFESDFLCHSLPPMTGRLDGHGARMLPRHTLPPVRHVYHAPLFMAQG